MPDFEPALIALLVFYFLAVVFYLIGAWNTRKARSSALKTQASITQILEETVGKIPDFEGETPPNSTPAEQIMYLVRLCVVYTMVYLALYVVIGAGIRLVWASRDESRQQLADIGLSVVLPLVLGWAIFPLVSRWFVLSAPEHKLTKREKNWLSAIALINFLAILTDFLSIPLIVDPAYGPTTAFAVYFVMYIIFFFLWQSFARATVYFPRYWIHTALAKADYDEALRRVSYLEKKYDADIITRHSRGTILLFAGNFSEAESVLRECLPEARKRNKALSESFTNLGYALLHQGRYDEAVPPLQAAMRLNPKGGHAHSGLAEVYLYQGIEAQKALDITVDFLKNTPRRQVKQKSIWGSIVGDEAWALALVGRHDDAQYVIKEAFELTDKSFKPGLASLHLREGKVFQSQGNTTKAAKAFQQAIDLDYFGMYGELARQALAGLQKNGR